MLNLKLEDNIQLPLDADQLRQTHRYTKLRGSFSGSWYVKNCTGGILSSCGLVQLVGKFML